MKYNIAILLLLIPTHFYSMQQPAPQEIENIKSAIEEQDILKIKQILKSNPNQANSVGVQLTPLHYAATIGNADTIQALLDAGADVDYTENYGITPLMLAALGLHAEAVKLLIEYGADANAADDGGQTVLMYVQLGGASTQEQKAEITDILKQAIASLEKTKIG